jgi:hypothetical protein
MQGGFMMAKLLSIAMAAGLIVGSTAMLHAQQSGTPRSGVQGGATRAPGFAPGPDRTTGAGPRDDSMDWDRDNAGTMGVGDRDDRTTGAGARDDRMLGHEHDEGR